jgi:hypothetical protein
MHTDSYYAIGTYHSVCQDYALSGSINKNISYAIISDGCSSSLDVDVGARILAHSAKDFFIFQYKGFDSIRDDISRTEEAFRNYIHASSVLVTRHLRLPLSSLNATLVAVITDGITTRLFIYGDGGVILGNKDGSITYHYVHYDQNAPYYLSYDMDEKFKELYLKDYSDQIVYFADETFTIDNVTNKMIVCEQVKIKDFSYNNHDHFCETNGIYFAMCVSDGIHSFLDMDFSFPTSQKASKEVGYIEIVNQMCAIKNYNGSFIQRRMGRIKRDFSKIDRVHFDDVSVSAIYMSEEKDADNSICQEQG